MRSAMMPPLLKLHPAIVRAGCQEQRGAGDHNDHFFGHHKSEKTDPSRDIAEQDPQLDGLAGLLGQHLHGLMMGGV